MKTEQQTVISMNQNVIDKITGFKGVIVGRSAYVTGCTQLLLQPVVKENGEYIEGRWFDENRLESNEAAPVADIKTNREIGPGPQAPIK